MFDSVKGLGIVDETYVKVFFFCLYGSFDHHGQGKNGVCWTSVFNKTGDLDSFFA